MELLLLLLSELLSGSYTIHNQVMNIDSAEVKVVNDDAFFSAGKEDEDMTYLNFDETAIINQTLDVENKTDYLKKLNNLLEHTPDKELAEVLEGLISKIEKLPEADFIKLYEDRNAGKIYTFPPYVL